MSKRNFKAEREARRAEQMMLKARLQATGGTEACLENGKVVGWWGLTWDNQGSKQLLVFIPAK